MTKTVKLNYQNYAKYHNKKQKLVKFIQFPLIQNIKTIPISVFTTFQEIFVVDFTAFQGIFKAVFTAFQEIFVGVFTTFQGIFGEKRWFLLWVMGLSSCGAFCGIFGGGVGRWRLCRSKSKCLCPIFDFSTRAVPTAPLPATPISI